MVSTPAEAKTLNLMKLNLIINKMAEKTVAVRDMNLNFTEFCIAMHKNDWFIPSMKSNLVTMEYLKKVRSKEIKCPKYSEVRLRSCPVFPEKKQIVQALLSLAQLKNWDFGFKESGPQPDSKWMI